MTSIEFIPARLRSAFREYARGIVVHDIERMWQDEQFAPGDGQSYSGVRMSLWSSYEASVQWWNRDHVARVLRVYEECISGAEPEQQEKFAQQLARDGFRLAALGKIEYVADTSRISEVTRAQIVEYLISQGKGTFWSGGLEEIEFLKRLYTLTAMPSDDPRFNDAEQDIWQHTVNNDDFPLDWVFHDPRFQLSAGSDVMLLRFLAEMLHPAVRTNPQEVAALLPALNDALAPDGYELYPRSSMSGRPVFGWRSRRGFHGSSPSHLLQNRPAVTDPGVLQDHLDRIGRVIEDDPAAAIEPPRRFRRLHFLGGSGTWHDRHRITARRCASAQSGWSLKSKVTMRRSSRR